MPIHIIRDVALTIRSFYKRITDFMKYRHATRDMNQRYPDATESDLVSEDVCIICRETLRPWQGNGSAGEAGQADSQANDADERYRPKKLPCGHVLHFSCLRSWLERQQNCPTCRQPVLTTSPNTPSSLAQPRVEAAGAQNQADVNGRGYAADGRDLQRPQQAGQNRFRFFNLGPIRLGFGAGPDAENLAQEMQNHQPPRAQAPRNRNGGLFQQLRLELGIPPRGALPDNSRGHPSQNTIRGQLRSIEQQLLHDIEELRLQSEQLQTVRALQGELARLRIAQTNHSTNGRASTDQPNFLQPNQRESPSVGYTPRWQTFGTSSQENPTSSGNRELPAGVVIPEGWTFLPLQRRRIGMGNPPTLGGTFRDPVQQSIIPSNSNSVNNQASDQPENSASHSQQNLNSSHPPTSTLGGSSNIHQVQQPTVPDGVLGESSSSAQGLPGHSNSQPESSGRNKGQNPLPGEQSRREGGAEILHGNSATESRDDSMSMTSARPLDLVQGGLDESAGSAEAAERRLSKGKARATTVEDVEDGG